MSRDDLEAEATALRAKIARGYGRSQGYGQLAAEDAEDADLARLSEVERLLSDVCTCTVVAPMHESVIGGQYGQAVYIDAWTDDTIFDPGCVFHGDSGTIGRGGQL